MHLRKTSFAPSLRSNKQIMNKFLQKFKRENDVPLAINVLCNRTQAAHESAATLISRLYYILHYRNRFGSV